MKQNATSAVLHKNRTWHRGWFALAIVLVLLIGAIPAAAAEAPGEDYTYTVRIFPGAQGTFTERPVLAGKTPTVGSSGELVYAGLKKTDRVVFDIGTVTVKNPDKYRATEIRISGKDNQDAAARRQNFAVDQDVDCVVAYTVRSANEIPFTVHYRTVDGTALAEDSVFYGNEGDTMYVGSKWVDDYFPNAYNREIRFSGTASENEYTFIYQPNTPAPTPAPTPAVAPTTAPGVTTAPTVTGTTGTGAGTVNTIPGIAGTGTDTTDTGTDAGETEPGETTEDIGTEGEEPAGQTEANALPASPDEVPEILDIEDEEVPLANFPGAAFGEDDENETGISGNMTGITDDDTPASGFSAGVRAGIGAAIAAAVAVIVAVLLLLGKRRRKKDEETEKN